MSAFLDKLTEAFSQFEFVPSTDAGGPALKGFANFTCCTTCSRYEMGEDLIAENKDRIAEYKEECLEEKREFNPENAMAEIQYLNLGGIAWHAQEDESVRQGNRDDIWLGYMILGPEGLTEIEDETHPHWTQFMNLVKEALEPWGMEVKVPPNITKKIQVIWNDSGPKDIYVSQPDNRQD